MRFFITDVFGEDRYSGNQLATYFAGDSLTTMEMQQIAREIHFSETTFVLSDVPGKNGYSVRIFTPAQEVDFAGHPTIGTAFIIKDHILKHPIDKLTLDLRVGPTPVAFSDDGIVWMDQMEPIFRNMSEREGFMPMLNLPPEALDPNFPIEQVSTGLPHILIPIRNLDYLKQAKIVRELYFELIEKTWAKNIFLFCPEGYTSHHDISARMFADYLGIPEDPATGSGNGCLAGYLIKNRFFHSSEINIKVAQGYEIHRPSTLSLQAKEQEGSIRIRVGGKVSLVAEGSWI